ncbi:hypothetical protein ALC53_13633 [Atta colombica]|uniref:Uncharacterized protein n=1 Tax=Atta colombica TaxID=520822 RepID=A0A195AV68_9HYME|nr:hypothetical protein ALC53_13633 [Atta colombica]
MNKKTVDHHDIPDQNSRSCRVLSIALSDIIRHSGNVNFRDHCFEVLRTDSSFGAQMALSTNLLSIVFRNHSAREKQAEMENETIKNTENET